MSARVDLPSGAGGYVVGTGEFADGAVGYVIGTGSLSRRNNQRELYSYPQRAREKSCCCEQYTQAQFVVYAHLFGVYD